MIDHIFFEALYDGKEVTEIAAVRTNRKGVHFEAFSEKVKTRHLEGTLLSTALSMMTKRLLDEKYSEDYIVVAFREPKVIELQKALPKAWITLSNLAWPLAYSGLISSITLDSVSKHHGVVNKHANTAEGNVVTIMDTYWNMMRRYKTALSAEDGLRSAAGQGFEELRRKFGF
jgi:hypothetical protein